LETKCVRIEETPITLGESGWQEWEVGSGEIGELVISGDHVGREYYRNPEATAANKVQDGHRCWHRMGDTGYFDSKGFFWLTGRVHSTIRRAGQLIHPQLVEQAADGVDVVRTAALGVEDDVLGERVVLVVESSKSEKDFAKQIAERLHSRSILIDEILISSQPLPVDPRHNSKIDYGQLGSLVSQQRSAGRFTSWQVDELLPWNGSEVGNHE
jgi:acyl-CoA synthetase (AMP-forming)/AMP-acid ligase II